MPNSVATRSSNPSDPARSLAYGLGWFSLVLGLGEILAPRQIKRSIGATAPKSIFQSYGLREIAAGAMILMSRDPNKMVWGRVAGDLLDIATLAPTLRRTNPHRPAASGAMAFVLLATALDVYTAMMQSRSGTRRRSDRRAAA